MKDLTIGEIVSVLEEADELEEKLEVILEKAKEPPTLDVVKEASEIISKLNTLMRRMKY
jgi:hypothetical protein